MAFIIRKKTRAVRRQVRDGTDFTKAPLAHAKLFDLDLRQKSFAGADLRGADLTACDLRGAELRGADLEGAILTGARLNGADLRDATLDWAYMIASELDGAQLEGASLKGVIYDQATVWPAGFRPPRPKLHNFGGATYD